MAKFKGYNTQDEWRDVVVTMVKYGAELKEPEVEVLVAYLGKHFSQTEIGHFCRVKKKKKKKKKKPTCPTRPRYYRWFTVIFRLGFFPTGMRATSFRDATSIAETASWLSTAT